MHSAATTSVVQADQTLLQGCEVWCARLGILLPQLVKTFEDELRKSLSQQLTERAMTGLPKCLNQWLHLQLEAIFSYHLQCGCATRKQGTLLYRTGSDLIKALTVALADTNAKSQELKALSEKVKALQTTINETNEDALLKSVAITKFYSKVQDSKCRLT